MTSMAEATVATPDLEMTFFLLYERERPLVLRYIRAAVGDLGTAEDLTADTFFRAWDGWYRFKGENDVARTWLMRIARNRLIDHARRNKQVAFIALDESRDRDDRDFETATVNRMAVLTALASLKVEERDLLALRISGLSHAEIGVVLKRSDSAVRKAWQRALLKLRPQLEVMS